MWKWFISAVLLIGSGFIQAATVEDVVTLTQKGVGDEVMLAFVETSEPVTLTADDILKLKDAKVSKEVVVAILKHCKPVAHEVIAERQPIVIRAKAEPIRAQPVRVVQEPIQQVEIVEAPTVRYVYTDYPSAYPYYSYPCYRPYYYPSFSVGFGFSSYGYGSRGGSGHSFGGHGGHR
jgi:hypothetical protein